MEGLVVFGIVCNVIQVVDFGLKTISKGREIAKKGATADILDAGFIAQHLDDLGDALSKSIPTPVANQQLSRSDQQLVDIATKCRDLAKDLSLEVAKLKPAQVAKKWKTFVRLVETLWKTSKIEQMKTRLEAHRRTLDTVLLAKLSRQFDVTALAHEAKFAELDTNLQIVLTGISAGKKTFAELSTLTSREASLTRQHVTEEHEKTRLLSAQGNAAVQLENEHQHNRTREKVESSFRALDLSSSQDKHQKDQQRLHAQLLSTLHFPEMFARHETIYAANKDSYDWLFDESTSTEQKWPSYIEWLQAGSNVYWVSGKPGAGKSTFMRFIYNHHDTRRLLRVWAGTKKLCIPAFFFWNPGSTMQKSQLGMLKSLMYQILVAIPELSPRVVEMQTKKYLGDDYASHMMSNFNQQYTWTVPELLKTLQFILESAVTHVQFCFFLDGLDELEGTPSDQVELVDLIKSLGHARNIKFCVSSRRYHYFQDAFTDLPEMRLHDLTRRDMVVFVEDKIGTRLLLLAKTEVERNQARMLEETLLEKAEGVFLWLTLAVKELTEGTQGLETFAELNRRLNSIPQELNQLYERLLKRIPDQHRMEAASIFRHILCRSSDVETSSLLDIVLDIYFSPSIALDPEIIQSHLEKNHSAEVHAVWLVARTGGLVETKAPDNLYKGLIRKMTFLGNDVVWCGTEVDVLHRSVIEFFLETPLGGNWLNSWGCSWSKSYQNFAYGKLRHALLLSPHACRVNEDSLRQDWTRTVTRIFEAANRAETYSGLAQSQLVSDLDTSLSAHWFAQDMYDLQGDETYYSQFAQTQCSWEINWIASYVWYDRIYGPWARFDSRSLLEEFGPFGVDVGDLAILFSLTQCVVKEAMDCVEKSTIENDVQSLLNKRLSAIGCCNCTNWSDQDFETYGKLVIIFLRLGANPNFEDSSGHTIFQLLCRGLGVYAAEDMFDRRFGSGYVAQSKGCLPAITEIIEAFMQHGADASRTFHLFYFKNRGSSIYIQVGILELVGILYGRHVHGRPTAVPQSFTDLLKSRGARPCFTVERATVEVGIERASSDDFSAKLLHLLQFWESHPDRDFAIDYERIEPAGSWEVIHRHDHTELCVICEHVNVKGRGSFENFPQEGDQDYEDFWFAPHDVEEEEYSDPPSPGRMDC